MALKNINTIEEELATSILSKDQIKDTINNYNNLFNTNINYKRVNMLQQFILDDNPSLIFRGISEASISTLNALETQITKENSILNPTFSEYINGNITWEKLVTLISLDPQSYHKDELADLTEEMKNSLLSPMFLKFIEKSIEVKNNLKNINGKIVDITEIKDKRFYIKNKNAMFYKNNISFLFPDYHLYQLFINSNLDLFFENVLEKQYSFSKKVNGETLFIHVNLLPISAISYTKIINYFLEDCVAYVRKSSKNGAAEDDFKKMGRLKEINRDIEKFYQNYYISLGSGISESNFSANDIPMKNITRDIVVNGEKIFIYDNINNNKKWNNIGVSPASINSPSFYSKELLSEYCDVALKIIYSLKKIPSHKALILYGSMCNSSNSKEILNNIERYVKSLKTTKRVIPFYENKKLHFNSYGSSITEIGKMYQKHNLNAYVKSMAELLKEEYQEASSGDKDPAKMISCIFK